MTDGIYINPGVIATSTGVSESAESLDVDVSQEVGTYEGAGGEYQTADHYYPAEDISSAVQDSVFSIRDLIDSGLSEDQAQDVYRELVNQGVITQEGWLTAIAQSYNSTNGSFSWNNIATQVGNALEAAGIKNTANINALTALLHEGARTDQIMHEAFTGNGGIVGLKQACWELSGVNSQYMTGNDITAVQNNTAVTLDRIQSTMMYLAEYLSFNNSAFENAGDLFIIQQQLQMLKDSISTITSVGKTVGDTLSEFMQNFASWVSQS